MRFDIEEFIPTKKDAQKPGRCRVCDARLSKPFMKDCDRCSKLSYMQLKEIIKGLREQLAKK